MLPLCLQMQVIRILNFPLVQNGMKREKKTSKTNLISSSCRCYTHPWKKKTLFLHPGWCFGCRDLTAFYLAGNALPTEDVKGEPHRARLSWGTQIRGRDLVPCPAPRGGDPGTGGCETCAPEAEVHEQSRRVLQRVVGQAVGVFQRVDQPEDEAVSNHGRLQRAPRAEWPTVRRSRRGDVPPGRRSVSETTARAGDTGPEAWLAAGPTQCKRRRSTPRPRRTRLGRKGREGGTEASCCDGFLFDM